MNKIEVSTYVCMYICCFCSTDPEYCNVAILVHISSVVFLEMIQNMVYQSRF